MADFYRTLGVAHDASEADIKQAYRRLAMQYHPDRNSGSKDAEEMFKQITEAYDVLRDPQKRSLYDRFGEAGLRGGAGFHHVDLSEALGIFMRDLGGFSAFGDLFGAGGRGQQSPRAGADVRVTVPLTLAEAASGVEKNIAIRLLEPCDKCDATGAEPPSKPRPCPSCGGTGEVRRAQRSFFGQVISVSPCPSCSGNGTIIETPCRKCRGEGRVKVERQIPVTIPPGVATGQYMTIRGVGNAGPRGGTRGDLLVVFEVEDDARFERDGEDLYTDVLVTYPQLALGAAIEVPTITASVTLRIPAGTQSGQTFNLRGRGLPRVNASGVGDLHVRVQLWTPDEIGGEEKKLVERLAGLRESAPQRVPQGFWAKVKESLGA